MPITPANHHVTNRSAPRQLPLRTGTKFRNPLKPETSNPSILEPPSSSPVNACARWGVRQWRTIHWCSYFCDSYWPERGSWRSWRPRLRPLSALRRWVSETSAQHGEDELGAPHVHHLARSTKKEGQG